MAGGSRWTTARRSSATCWRRWRSAGLVEVVDARSDGGRRPGLPDPGRRPCCWVAGDGTRAFHDPIRVPRAPEAGGRTNPFFVELLPARRRRRCTGLEAREHTAQVPYDERQEREDAFREGELPVLYCSPTMELGVDIADLNVVEHAERPADAGQLRPAERPGGPQRAAGPGRHLLLDRQLRTTSTSSAAPT